MPSKIILKKSSVASKVPVAGDLDFGELAINYSDSKLYFKKADGSIGSFTSATAAVNSVAGYTGDVTATNLLDAIKTVDGTGSGLDADTLDGLSSASFYLASNPNGYTNNTGTVTSVGATSPVLSSGGNTPTISIPAATASAAGHMTSAYAAKLDGIAAGAQVNTVTSVAGKTGAVTLVKGDVGLDNVDNTADSAKSVASADILTTARTINGVSFNGSANITLPTVNTSGNQTITGTKTFSGIVNPVQILQGTPNTFVRDYASGYNTLHTPTAPQEMGRITFTGDSQNITIIGEIRGASGASVGVTRFILDLRSNVLPSKSFTLFEEDITNLGRLIRVRVYQDTASGLVIIGYSCTIALQNIGWSFRVQERGNYNYLQQVTALTPIDTVGLTEVNLTSTVRTMSSALVVDNGITGNLTGNAATATTLQTARTINGVSFNGSANITVADSTKQPLDADLTAIAALTGTSGLLRKTAADTWSLDTNAYVTSSGVTSVSGTAPIVSSGGTTPAISISAATTSAAGSMSAVDKTKLDGIASGATANTGTVTSVSGTGTVSGLTLSGSVTSSGNLTLGGTLSLTSANVTSALGYTPYDSTNPNGYTTNTGTVTSVATSGTVSGLTLTGGTITTSGTITLGGSLSASISNISDATRWWNNFGDNHSTRTSFDATSPSYGFGWRYVQGTDNGPNTGGTQYYSMYTGLGNDYPATGAGSYGMYIAIDRNSTTPYLSVRYNEANSLSTWRRINAGGADAWTTARTLTVGNTGKSVNGSANVSWTLAEIGAYAATNPSGYTTNTGTVTSVGGTGGYGGLTLTGTVTTSGNLTLGGTPTGTWPISVSGSSASTTGNAATATKLQTARTINGVSFDGTANINIATKLTILSRAATSVDVAIANALLSIVNRAGSTINVAVS